MQRHKGSCCNIVDYCIDQFGCFMMDLQKMNIHSFLNQMRVNDFKIEKKTILKN